jgi:hypothetical protein
MAVSGQLAHKADLATMRTCDLMSGASAVLQFGGELRSFRSLGVTLPVTELPRTPSRSGGAGLQSPLPRVSRFSVKSKWAGGKATLHPPN